MRAFSFTHTRCLVNFAAKSRRRAPIKPRRLQSLGGYSPSNGILTARAVFWAAARAHYSRAFINVRCAKFYSFAICSRRLWNSVSRAYKHPPRKILLQLADFDFYAVFCVGEAYRSSAAVLVAANLIIDRASLQALREAMALARVATAEDRFAV